MEYFKHAEIFIGAENMTNYQQKPDIRCTPYSTYFDTYQVYAPIMGATVYGGFRILLTTKNKS